MNLSSQQTGNSEPPTSDVGLTVYHLDSSRLCLLSSDIDQTTETNQQGEEELVSGDIMAFSVWWFAVHWDHFFQCIQCRSLWSLIPTDDILKDKIIWDFLPCLEITYEIPCQCGTGSGYFGWNHQHNTVWSFFIRNQSSSFHSSQWARQRVPQVEDLSASEY